MREYQQKQIWRKLFYSRIFIVILFLIFILLLRSVVDLNDKRVKVNVTRNESILKLNTAQEKLNKSEEKYGAILTERGVENYIRKTFPVVKDGEGVIVVYDASNSPVVPVKKDNGYFAGLVVWIKGIFIK